MGDGVGRETTSRAIGEPSDGTLGAAKARMMRRAESREDWPVVDCDEQRHQSGRRRNKAGEAVEVRSSSVRAAWAVRN